MRQTADVKVQDTIVIGIRDIWDLAALREFYEKNRWLWWLVLALTVTSWALGLGLFGPVAGVIGTIFSIVVYFLGPLAVTKVRGIDRRRGGER